MFIKRTRGGSPQKPIYYLQLAKSYRDRSGKPRHKVIFTLGREEDVVDSNIVDFPKLLYPANNPAKTS